MNIALKAAKRGEKAVLVDLDIVNPYFRSADHDAMLEAHGIKVIVPPYAKSGVDLPIVPAEVASVFVQDYDCVVFDVGGDSVGATVLGRYYKEFEKKRNILQVCYVVNIRRPLASTADDICTMFEQIGSASRLEINGFINNSNLGRETTVEDLIEGVQVLKEVTTRTGVRVTYISGYEHILAEFNKKMNNIPYEGVLLPICTYTRPVWLDL